MKYTLTWTDANGKCWHLRKPYSNRVINRKLHQIMPPIKRKNGTHAVLITLTIQQ